MKRLRKLEIKSFKQLIIILVVGFCFWVGSVYCLFDYTVPDAKAGIYGDNWMNGNEFELMVNMTFFEMDSRYIEYYGEILPVFPANADAGRVKQQMLPDRIGQWSCKEVFVDDCLVESLCTNYTIADDFKVEFFHNDIFQYALRSAVSYLSPYSGGYTYAWLIGLERGLRGHKVRVMTYDMGAGGGFDRIAEQPFYMAPSPDGFDYDSACEPECELSCGETDCCDKKNGKC